MPVAPRLLVSIASLYHMSITNRKMSSSAAARSAVCLLAGKTEERVLQRIHVLLKLKRPKRNKDKQAKGMPIPTSSALSIGNAQAAEERTKELPRFASFRFLCRFSCAIFYLYCSWASPKISDDSLLHFIWSLTLFRELPHSSKIFIF